MKTLHRGRLPAVLLCVCGALGQVAVQADELKTWKEFVALVRAGDFPADRLKPLAEGYENVLLEYLSAFQIGPRSSFFIPHLFPVWGNRVSSTCSGTGPATLSRRNPGFPLSRPSGPSSSSCAGTRPISGG